MDAHRGGEAIWGRLVMWCRWSALKILLGFFTLVAEFGM